MTCILVATDGSEAANRAVEYAAHRAGTDGAELLIVNIMGGYGLPDSVVQAFTQAQQAWWDELLTSLSAKTLTKARERALQSGARTVFLESRSGEVSHALLELAEQKHVDAIVIGKRGAGRVAGLLLGSVSQKIVSLASVPVTVVP